MQEQLLLLNHHCELYRYPYLYFITHKLYTTNVLKIDLVKEAKGTFGYYDILVKIEASSEKEIEMVITKKIRGVKNVNTTTTLSVISEQEDL